jgi:hypothetical protein
MDVPPKSAEISQESDHPAMRLWGKFRNRVWKLASPLKQQSCLFQCGLSRFDGELSAVILLFYRVFSFRFSRHEHCAYRFLVFSLGQGPVQAG